MSGDADPTSSPPPDDALDPELLASAVAGDVLALHALLNHFERPLLAYVNRVLPEGLRNTYDPLDILQETSIEAFRHVGTLRAADGAGVGAWLKTIARNRITSLARSHAAAKRGGGRQLDFTAAAGATGAVADGDGDDGILRLLDALAVYHRTPSQSAAAHELALVLDNSIQELPEDQRRAIRLRHFEGLSADVAAQRMDRSEQAFHALCTRGYKQLRRVMRSRSFYV